MVADTKCQAQRARQGLAKHILHPPCETSKCYCILLTKTRNLLHVFARSASKHHTVMFLTLKVTQGKIARANTPINQNLMLQALDLAKTKGTCDASPFLILFTASWKAPRAARSGERCWRRMPAAVLPSRQQRQRQQRQRRQPLPSLLPSSFPQLPWLRRSLWP